MLEVRTLGLVDELMFQEVVRLAKRNSRTVGYLPVGAFVDYLGNKGILVAIDGQVVGFVLHRTSRETVRVAQLVVARGSRGRGIARLLIQSLCRHRCACYAMRLRCREDFAVAAMWPHFGFMAIGRIRGRAGILVCWWRRLGAEGLFAADVAGVAPRDGWL